MQVGDIAYLIARHEPWPERCKGVVTLSARAVGRRPDSDVETYGVTKHSAQGIGLSDVAAALAHHHNEFAFVMNLLASTHDIGWQADVLPRSNHGRRRLKKDVECQKPWVHCAESPLLDRHHLCDV